MPVQKFHDFEEARQALHCDPHDPRLPDRIQALWSFSRSLTSPDPFPRGIHRYRTIEEANAARFRWEGEHIRKLREKLAAGRDPAS